jgi:hypothetical protein
VDVTIKMFPPAGKHGASQGSQLAELRRVLKDFRVEPIHPGSKDPTLSSYYRAQVPDLESARKAMEVVRGLSSVTAAYMKPEDELP